MSSGSEAFHKELAIIGELHDRKQHDYGRDGDPFANVRGSTAFGIPPWIGAMMRANDKMSRIQNHANGRTLTNESVRDSFRDLAVYSLIALVLYDEEDREKGEGR